MTSLSAIALGGMHAAQTALGASAHNIANLGTPGSRRQLVVQSTVADGGVAAALRPAGQPGPALERDLVGLLVAKNQFLANLAVFKTGDALMGSLLDATG